MTNMRTESDSLGVVEVPADVLWGAQTQRSLEHFNIGSDLIPREMYIVTYAVERRICTAATLSALVRTATAAPQRVTALQSCLA
jgi:fumarate hydratase, class II